jgi:predicted Zn-dependent peptidase
MVFIKLSQHFSLSLSFFSQRFEKIEEEIEMLQCKLKNIEKGIAFSGKKTKTARSQGRRFKLLLNMKDQGMGLLTTS